MSKMQNRPPAQADVGANRPVHTLRHRRLKATIWRNETEKGPMFNVTIIRSYRDDQDQWHDSQSFGYDDLMNVAALMYEPHAVVSSLVAKESAAARAGRRAT